MKTLSFGLTCLLIFIGCTSSEIGNSKDVNPQTIFISYSIFGEEGDDSVTCRAQFRFAGENGTTLVLNEPCNIELDKMPVAVDSNDITGAFYEKRFSAASFGGIHSWKYIDGELNNYSTRFEFNSFGLKNRLPSSVSRKDSLVIELSGLQDGTPLTAELSDTSSKTGDLTFKTEIKEGRIIMPSAIWQKLRSGPISIQISNTVDESLPVDERPAEGGRLFINYSLKERTFTLKDDAPDFAEKF